MAMTNAEKIAWHIAKHGTRGIRIKTIPNTRFWLYCETTQKNRWRIILCDPDKTTWRLVSDHVPDNQILAIWRHLLTITLTNRIARAVGLLKK